MVLSSQSIDVSKSIDLSKSDLSRSDISKSSVSNSEMSKSSNSDASMAVAHSTFNSKKIPLDRASKLLDADKSSEVDLGATTNAGGS